MTKNTITVLVLAVMLMSILAACAAPSQPAAPATPKAVTKVFKVGVSGPMGFDNGKLALAGAKLAAEEINAAGGFKAVGQTAGVIQAV